MDRCPTCNKKIKQTPGAKRRKIYCNSTCRSKHWHRERAAEKKTKDVQGLPLPKDYVPYEKISVVLPDGKIEELKFPDPVIENSYLEKRRNLKNK